MYLVCCFIQPPLAATHEGGGSGTTRSNEAPTTCEQRQPHSGGGVSNATSDTTSPSIGDCARPVKLPPQKAGPRTPLMVTLDTFGGVRGTGASDEFVPAQPAGSSAQACISKGTARGGEAHSIPACGRRIRSRGTDS